MTRPQCESSTAAAFVNEVGEFEVSVVASIPEIPFAHEAGIWLPATREVVFTSNQFFPACMRGKTKVTVSILSLDDNTLRTILPSPPIEAANGGTNYKGKALICQQGQGEIASGLVLLDTSEPYKTQVLLDSFHGRPFNSPNDVVILGLDDSIWFTDPNYGKEQCLKSECLLPNQVYCYDPKKQTVRVVADGFEKPNGIAFSNDYKVCYITDTGAFRFDGKTLKVDSTGASTIYSYDVIPLPSGKQAGYTLVNRRVFAYSATPAPDGIKIDSNGNVWSGCSDGIHVWNRDGVFLGKIPIEGGVANFVFTDPGTLIAFNETRLLKITNLKVRGVLDTSL
ncbi:Gluconolactonase [Wickerhamiella sorbophila]|uniref:Gluconolactonase n=1 Tax=Wickerhamiella sorbophila TaxID=45607 RepID=A0A2T0FNK5_9ASCO|nr:Gluconolactonase [Wickerhamiella sorbophila]PRT56572.1 Gluconolactonase [Wickerhamiella sorbophila]